MAQIYSHLAEIAAGQKSNNEIIDYLANAIKYSKIFDTQESLKNISLLVNRMSYNSNISSKNYMSNDSYLRLEEMQNDRYDFCCDDERFVKLTEDLKKVATGGK